jgi:sulfur carrier protein
MKIVVNGENHILEESLTIRELIGKFGINTETVVVELNKQIVAKENFGSTKLNDSDKVEIVHFVGGG